MTYEDEMIIYSQCAVHLKRLYERGVNDVVG